jgi:hypothetical protein
MLSINVEKRNSNSLTFVYASPTNPMLLQTFVMDAYSVCKSVWFVRHVIMKCRINLSFTAPQIYTICCEDNYSCNISFPPSNTRIQYVCKGLHEAPEMQNKPFFYGTSNISCVNVKEAKTSTNFTTKFRIFGHHQVYLWV